MMQPLDQKPSENETLEASAAKEPLHLAGTADFDFKPIPVAAARAATVAVVAARAPAKKTAARRSPPKARAMLVKTGISAKG